MGTIEDLRIESQPAHAPRRRVWPIALIVLALIGAGAGWWALKARNGASDFKTIEVITVAAPGGSGPSGFSASGYLEIVPPGPETVSAMVEGRVQSLSVIEGQTVEAGQEVARLDDAAYRQEIAVAEAAVAVAQARLDRLAAGFRKEEVEQAQAERDRASARADQARREHERNEKLAATGAVAQRVADGSHAELAAAKAELALRAAELAIREQGYRKEDIAVARAELAAAEAALERAAWRLERCVINVSSPGIVLDRLVRVGDWVSPGGSQPRAGAILTIADPRQLQAWVDVNQRDMGKVSVGQEAVLVTDAQPDRPLAGRVSRVLPLANLSKNTVRVNVEIADPSTDLRPDMSVKVTFKPNNGGSLVSNRSELAIPASAVVRQGPDAGVYLVADGRATLRKVALGAAAADRVIVDSGLSPGDRIVLNASDVRDGERVQAKK